MSHAYRFTKHLLTSSWKHVIKPLLIIALAPIWISCGLVYLAVTEAIKLWEATK